MKPSTSPWFRHRFKLLAALLVLLGGIASVIAILAWKHRADANAKENPTADSEPKLMLAEYTLPINAMTFSPDGKLLATAAMDLKPGKNRRGEIRIWDVSSWREQRGCQDFTGRISALAFSSDSKTLASGGIARGTEACGRPKEDGEVRLWEFENPAAPPVWQGTNNPVATVAFSPQGDKIAIGRGDGLLSVCNRATRMAELVSPAESGVSLSSNVAFSDDGKRVAWGGAQSSGKPKTRRQGIIHIWDATADKPLSGFAKPLTALHVPDDPKDSASIKCLTFLPGGDKLVGSCGRKIYFWDVKSGQIEATLSGHPNTIEALALSSDGQLLASMDNYGSIKLWQVSSHSERAALQNLEPARNNPHREGMGLALAFAPNGQTLISSMLSISGMESRGTVKLWNIATAKEIALPR